MKYILILSFFLSGCTSSITQAELHKSENFCKANGEVYSYFIIPWLDKRVDCKLGKKVWLSDLKD